MDFNELTKKFSESTSGQVFEEYHDAIYRYILRLVHDPDESEDLTQETFIRVHQHFSSLKKPTAIKAWLYRIATNVCYDRFRQAAFKSQAAELSPELLDTLEEQREDPDSPGLEQVIDQVEMSDCIQRYIGRLSDDHRIIILLHDLHGMTHPEIARQLNCSLETEKIRHYRARQKLKTTLAAGCKFTIDARGVLTCDPRLPNTFQVDNC
jgi:RNA polymerase sigma-70 factor (ECF subfamily)